MSKTWAPKRPSEVKRTARVKRLKAIDHQRETEAQQSIEETVHSVYSQRQYLNVYVYDPTEDGPEVSIIKAILSSHFQHELRA